MRNRGRIGHGATTTRRPVGGGTVFRQWDIEPPPGLVEPVGEKLHPKRADRYETEKSQKDIAYALDARMKALYALFPGQNLGHYGQQQVKTQQIETAETAGGLLRVGLTLR